MSVIRVAVTTKCISRLPVRNTISRLTRWWNSVSFNSFNNSSYFSWGTTSFKWVTLIWIWRCLRRCLTAEFEMVITRSWFNETTPAATVFNTELINVFLVSSSSLNRFKLMLASSMTSLLHRRSSVILLNEWMSSSNSSLVLLQIRGSEKSPPAILLDPSRRAWTGMVIFLEI